MINVCGFLAIHLFAPYLLLYSSTIVKQINGAKHTKKSIERVQYMYVTPKSRYDWDNVKAHKF